MKGTSFFFFFYCYVHIPCKMCKSVKKVKAFFLLLLLEMAEPGYLYRGKTFILPQTQGKGATPLFLCVKTKTASRTNCSPALRQRNCCGASWKREGNVIPPSPGADYER